MDAEINPGVRRLVAWLNRQGFVTTDSGDGVTNIEAGMECALPFPNVSIVPIVAWDVLFEAKRLARALGEIGIVVQAQSESPDRPCIQATFDPAGNSVVVMLTGVDDSMLPEGV